MDIKRYAKRLDGIEFGYPQLTEEEIEMARDNGFVVVYGASDDRMEFRGAIHDECVCYEGGEVFFNRNGVSLDERKRENVIAALWRGEKHDGKTICWSYKTDIPHETFLIYEDGEPYCRGIVFHVDDVG